MPRTEKSKLKQRNTNKEKRAFLAPDYAEKAADLKATAKEVRKGYREREQELRDEREEAVKIAVKERAAYHNARIAEKAAAWTLQHDPDKLYSAILAEKMRQARLRAIAAAKKEAAARIAAQKAGETYEEVEDEAAEVGTFDSEDVDETEEAREEEFA
jgi:hypothetical protein